MDLKQAVIGICMGSLLLALGLMPGLFQGLAEAVRNALASLQNGNLLSSRLQVHSGWHAPSSQPRWLAATGAALIAVTLLAYFSH